MKIVVVTQYFYPEEFKINDLVQEMVKKGNEVTVITGKPNYPSGKIAEGYNMFGTVTEHIFGAKVIRVPLIPRGKGGGIALALNYFSFVFFGVWYVKTHHIECDSIFCYETSPITQMFVALAIKDKCRKKASMWVQDLWPESVSAASNLKNKWIMSLLDKMVRKIYKASDTLFISSEGFKNSIVEKGDFESKIIYAPNWAEDLYLTKIDNPERTNQNFNIMFAGNIGEAQDFNNVVKAIVATKNHKNIKWLIVGDGRARESAEAKVKSEGVADNVVFLGRHKVEEMPHFFAIADCLLITLKDNPIFTVTLPSKTQTYMAFGKPILTMANGVASEVVTKASCGFVADSSDYTKLSHNAIEMSRLSKDQLDTMGKNAKVYYNTHFAKDKVVNTILSNL